MAARDFLESMPSARVLHRERDMSLFEESFIGWLVIDLEGRPVNVMNVDMLEQTQRIWQHILLHVKNGKIKVLVIASGKKDTFIAGADVVQLYPLTDRKAIEQASADCHTVMNQLLAFPIPTIAAVNGAALGGGCELALCCNYRVAADTKRVVMGLPEVKLGLLPAAGGTIRLPQIIGLQAALPILMTGGQVSSVKGKKLGLIDEVFPSEDRRPNEHRFFSQVRQFAISKIGSSAARRAVYKPATWKDTLLENTSIGRYVISNQAVKTLDQQTKGKYPASYFALDSALNAATASLIDAQKLEAKYFGTLGASPVSKSLISLFFLMEEGKKRKEKTNHAQVLPCERIGVIGAGVMGAQIGVILAGKGKSVYLRDIKDDIVKKGLKLVEDTYSARVKKGRMTAEKAKSTISLVQGGTDIKPFSTCNMLIEAAVEQMDLKKKILQQAEAVISDKTIFATNTSSLSITELATASKRPQNVVGLHFFNPVNKMPLVEIIRGKQTSDEACATAYQLALDLGKVPVICNDGPGFIVNRILGIYMNEAGHLVMEGYNIPEIDKALLDFGMPMGPFRLMDEVGLDVAGHVGPILENGLGQRFKQIPDFARVLKENPTHLGKKTNSGFFLYDENGKQKNLNPFVQSQISDILTKRARARSSSSSSTPSSSSGKVKSSQPPIYTSVESGAPNAARLIVDRCVLIMLNEACYILDDKIVATAGDLDLAMIMGTGFAPFTGGLLSYADSRGVDKIVPALNELKQKHGDRFTPHPMLLNMVANKSRFFPNRPDPKALTPITQLPRSKL